MTKVQWQVVGGLTPEQRLAIHESALRLIESVGIHVPSAEARCLLQGQAGVTFRDTTRACVAAERVAELFGPWPKPPPEPLAEPVFKVSGYALRCYDLRSGEIRASTVRDMVEFTKIAHALGASGSSIVMPRDMPQRLAEVATYKLCLDVSDRIFGAGTFSDAEVYDFVQDMLHALGHPYSCGMHMLSPMAFDPFLLDMAIRYVPQKAQFSCGTMPMQGATCPLQLPAALAQACAEVLGGAAILQMLAPQSEVDFVLFTYPFDMQYATIVYGGPDFILGNLATAQMSQFYGKTTMAKAFNNMSKVPGDAQLGHSAGAAAAVLAMAGLRNFGWAGVSCVDEIASVEQMIIEHEIFRASLHLANGFEFDANDLGEDAVRECTPANSFMTYEKTVREFRKLLFRSDIFSNETFAVWDKAGRPDIRKKAHDRALKLLEQHHIQRDPAEQQELDRLWKIAEQRFA